MNSYDRAYIEDIKKILQEHQRWLKDPSQGKRADLSFCELSNLNLSRVNLAHAKLTGAGLANAKLVEANLERADLFSADLELADLTGANLFGTDLRGACLNEACLANANMNGADLRNGSILEAEPAEPREHKRRFRHAVDPFSPHTELVDATLTGASMRSSRLNNADFTGADLRGADLSGSDLSGSILLNTDLSDTTMKEVVTKDTVMTGATIDDKVLARLRARGGVIETELEDVTRTIQTHIDQHFLFIASGGEDGSNIDLDMVDWPGAAMKDTNLSAIRIRRSKLRQADFSGSRLIMSDFSYCDLTGADFSRSDLSGCSFRSCNLAGAKFADSVINAVNIGAKRAEPWPANFQRARLANADLRVKACSRAIFRGTVLTGARVNLAFLRGAQLDGATLPENVTPEKVAQLQGRAAE